MSDELEEFPPCPCQDCTRHLLVTAVSQKWRNGDQESVRFVRPELAAVLDDFAEWMPR